MTTENVVSLEYDILTNICHLDCMCNAEGSVDNSCNENGKCSCNDNITGEKCDQCAERYVEFPGCDQCAAEYFNYPNCEGTLAYFLFIFFFTLMFKICSYIRCFLLSL